MVTGLVRFQAHFADYTQQYILIGGAACTLAMQNVGQQFRATKDLDLVLCVEALTPDFMRAFWDFIKLGGYRSGEHSTGKPQLYRFHKPTDRAFPFMLELFSRTPQALTLSPDTHLTPIPAEEEISSLSAILMDQDYYDFLLSGVQIVDGVSIAGADRLVPLKARAWLDLSRREQAGRPVGGSDVKKHKRDVFRLLPIVDPDRTKETPATVQADLREFVQAIGSQIDESDLASIGRDQEQVDTLIAELSRLYEL